MAAGFSAVTQPPATPDGADSEGNRVLCVGILILDVLGRPVGTMPDPARATLIDEIRMTAAGTAGGTSVDLARLGMRTSVNGAVGDDEVGDFLCRLLRLAGVDTRAVVRKQQTRTSASILAIQPDGQRPAWHVPGANALFASNDIAWSSLPDVDFVHLGGVTALPGIDGAPSIDLLRRAKTAGAQTTADCLGVKRPDALEILSGLLPHVDVFMPNDHEAMTVTGRDDPSTAAQQLYEMGAANVVVTTGADGAVLANSDGVQRIPAFDATAVDSTGCGDALCAGVIRGLSLGWPIREATDLGLAAAALTVQGLGSDAGVRSLEETIEYMTLAPRRAVLLA